MLSGLPGEIERYQLPGAPAAAAVRMALSGSALAVATAGDVRFLDAGTGEPGERLELPWEPDALALSPSGRLLAAGPRQPRGELLVHDRATSRTARLGKLPGGWLTGFAFAEHAGEEVLLASRDQHTLSVFTAANLEEMARLPGGSFEFDHLIGLGDGFVASVGHGSGETRDSLVVLPLADAVADPARAAAEWVGDELDWAYRVAAGPAGPGALVGARDPEDAEEPDPDDDEEDDLERPPLHGLRGLYVRDLTSGVARERIGWDGPFASGDPCFATPSWVAIATRARLELIRRDDSGEAAGTAAACTAVDALRRTVAVAQQGGTIAVLRVP